MPVTRHSASSRAAIHEKFQTATYYKSADEEKKRGQSFRPGSCIRSHKNPTASQKMKSGAIQERGCSCQ